MKTYEEKARNVFNRMEEEKETRRKQRKTAVRIAAPVLSVCLVAMLGIGVWQSGIFRRMPAIINAGESDDSGNSHSASTNDVQGAKTEAAEQNSLAGNSTAENSIVINQLSETPLTEKMNICLLWDDFVRMDRDELNHYYGTDIFPAVPDDLKSRDQGDDFAGYGIYRRDGGTGDVYYDTTVLNYSNEDFTRIVGVEAAKGTIPFQNFTVDTTEYKKSVISGQDAVIGFDIVTGNYFIGFMNDGIGFAVTAIGLSQEEVVAVIQSLLA